MGDEKPEELPEVSRALFDLDCDPLAARLMADGVRTATVMLQLFSYVLTSTCRGKGTAFAMTTTTNSSNSKKAA